MPRYSFEYLLHCAYALASSGAKDYELGTPRARADFLRKLREQVPGFAEASYRRAALSLWRLRLLAEKRYCDPALRSYALALAKLRRDCPGFDEENYRHALSLAAGKAARRAIPHFRC